MRIAYKSIIIWFCLLLVNSCASVSESDAGMVDQTKPSAQIDSETWFQQGNRYAEQDQLELAEQAYRQALQQQPHPKALHNLGLVQIRLGVTALKKARQSLPENASVVAATDAFVRLILLSALSQHPDN